MEIKKILSSSSEKELSASLAITGGKPRLLKAARSQIEMQWTALDELIDGDHSVRHIWTYVENLNLESHLKSIKSTEGNAGRSAIDPKILVALWLYATIENIGSARVLDRYTREHLAFKWICGGVPIARKTISDFRTNNGELFEELLAQGVAVLVKSGITVVEEIAQDGLRVRASAGRGSFRRDKTIKELYKQAKERLATLKKEIEEDPNGCISRQQAAKKQAAEAKLKRIEAAQKEFEAFIKQKECLRKKHKKKSLTSEEKENTKISTTDPEARVIIMPDKGYRPAYNFQYAVDTSSKIILGLDVVNAGTDGGQMGPMYEKIKNQYGNPKRYLVDGSFKNKEDIEYLSKNNCKVFMPALKRKNEKSIIAKESKELIEWRLRMDSEESKIVYKRRASSVEYVNAEVRKRGLYQIRVRGLKKAKGIASLYAVVHNMARSIALGVV